MSDSNDSRGNSIYSVSINGKDISEHVFDLKVQLSLLSPGSFSFFFMESTTEADFNKNLEFYKNNLGADVVIKLSKEVSFNGFISEIVCRDLQQTSSLYEIIGKGTPAKAEKIKRSRHFHKLSLADIVNKVTNENGISTKGGLKLNTKLHYTVQYNQSNLEFLTMLAERYGEWCYFDGQQLMLDIGNSPANELVCDVDIFDLSFQALAMPSKLTYYATDYFKAKLAKAEGAPSSMPYLQQAVDKGVDRVFKKNKSSLYSPSIGIAPLLETAASAHANGINADTVKVMGTTYDKSLNIGSKISLSLNNGRELGDFIIISIIHTITDQAEYFNTVEAIPGNITRPPYTNPGIFPRCESQIAQVTDNNDTDGLDRIKVKFGYATESDVESTSPWLPIVQPYAGKDRGFRFIPEINDWVMVGFLDGNMERPYIIGALYNESIKSNAIKDYKRYEKNEIKSIGANEGRCLEIDELEKTITIQDNFKGQFPRNSLQTSNDDGKLFTELISSDGQSVFSKLRMEEGKSITIEIIGKKKASIKIDGDDGKITVTTDGPLELKSQDNIVLDAMKDVTISAKGNIALKATQKLTLEGVQLEGKATASLKLQGAQTEISGSAQAKLGGAMVEISGGLVKIN